MTGCGILRYFYALRWKASLFLFSSVFGFLYLFYRYMKKRTVRKMFMASMEIQKQEISDFQPDIVVGSSWGGAVSC